MKAYGFLSKLVTRSASSISRTRCTSVYRPLCTQKLQEEHQSLFLTVPPEECDRLYKVYSWRDEQKTLFKLLGELNIMVREPYQTIVSYLNRTDFSKPMNKYVLYGRFGTGKTFTINHLLHYGHNNDYLIVHCGAPHHFISIPREQQASDWKQGRVDTPVEAVMALQNFKNQNLSMLNKLQPKTTGSYKWSLRETTEVGEPLINVIDYGINRIKKASDCYAVLLKEVKQMARDGKCKVLVLVDLVNILYQEKSRLKYPDRYNVEVENITLARAYLKLLQPDWHNAAAILSVDAVDIFRSHTGALVPVKLESDLPKYLLGQKGFEALDPFIPIKVPDYDDFEFENTLDYYTERNFLTRPQSKTREGRDEIKFLSAKNPYQVYKLCSFL